MATDENHLNAKLHLGRIYYEEGNLEESKKMLDVCANEKKCICRAYGWINIRKLL